jgi:hypothetical protein
MKLSKLSARQLSKHLARAMKGGDEQMAKSASYFWAQRIEGGPAKDCTPKAKLRKAGLLPPMVK